MGPSVARGDTFIEVLRGQPYSSIRIGRHWGESAPRAQVPEAFGASGIGQSKDHGLLETLNDCRVGASLSSDDAPSMEGDLSHGSVLLHAEQLAGHKLAVKTATLVGYPSVV